MQDVARQTGGSLEMGPGTLYGCIKRMSAARLLEESGERPDPGRKLDDQRRRYYRLTDFGNLVLRAKAQQPGRRRARRQIQAPASAWQGSLMKLRLLFGIYRAMLLAYPRDFRDSVWRRDAAALS